jgi:DNA-binding SARP family transcriptional activator/streptogramin lyase
VSVISRMPNAATSDFNPEGGFAFRLLGSLEISVNGQPRELPRRKQRLLLTLLLLSQEEVISIDRLIDQLWGERPPKTAVGALQNLVSEVRKALGSNVVRTQAAGYSLGVPRESVDVHRFERLVVEAGDEESVEGRAQRLREALALWRGPPLLEFAGEPFAQVEIARLNELRILAREELAEAELELGHHKQLVRELEVLVIEQPLRERLRALLMIALYRSGRQAEALAAYQDARGMLADELGLDPSEELQQLERAILNHDPSLGRSIPAGTSPALPPRPLAPAFELRASRFRWRLAGAAAVALFALASLIAVITVALTRGSKVVIVPNSVAIIDPQTSNVVGDVFVGRRPVALAADEGGVWVANADDGNIAHVDAKTKEVIDRVRMGTDIRDLATGFGSVWVADGKDGTVTRFDPKRNETTPIRFSRRTLASLAPVNFVAAGAGRVWATYGNALMEIDPATNQVVSRTRIPLATGLAAGLGAAWVVTDDNRLLRIARGNSRAKVVEIAPLTHRGRAPTVGVGSVWLIVEHGTGEIWRVDPGSGAPRIFERAGRNPLDLAVAEDTGHVWAVDSTGAVIRINPNIELAVKQIRTAADIHSAIAIAAGEVWVAVPE